MAVFPVFQGDLYNYRDALVLSQYRIERFDETPKGIKTEKVKYSTGQPKEGGNIQ